MWLFGRDILHPESNLLIEYGFKRFKCPVERKSGNMYLLDRGNGNELALWGFGILQKCENREPLFLRRYVFEPRLLSRATFDWPIWGTEYFEAIAAKDAIPDEPTIVVELIEWIEDYENWVINTAGRDWRNRSFREWSKSATSYRGFVRGWQKLRRKIETL
jgi:hypothetical protein